MRRRTLGVTGLVLLAMLAALPLSAEAAFPGKNGKIAFVRGGDIWTVNPDGTNRVQITSHPENDSEPAWSPDGTEIAFTSRRDAANPNSPCPACKYEVYVMDADGSNVHRLTTSPGAPHVGSGGPSWSPDGTRIAFGRATHLWTIAVDGTDEQRVTPDNPECAVFWGPPHWSPDGTELAAKGGHSCFQEYEFICLMSLTGVETNCWEAFGAIDLDWSPDASRLVIGTFAFYSNGMHTVATHDGGPLIELTDGTTDDYGAWSPDGKRIVFSRATASAADSQLHILNAADGSNVTPLSAGDAVEDQPDWQPIPINAYARPKGATPIKASLVPAYKQCTASNRTHGAPLSSPSCSPPEQASDELSLGTPDANGRPVKGIGQVEYKTLTGNLNTPADEADVQITVGVTDVYNQQTLADYTGELQVRTTLRITDKLNTPHPGGPGAATVSDTSLAATASCAATPDTTVGASCNLLTSADALVPGFVTEGRRANWELGQVRLNDGGADGDADTATDNTLFMKQGLFVP